MISPIVIGPCTIYCGDCLEILPTIEAGAVDAVVADPPYGVGFKYESHDDSEAAYEPLIVAVVAECCRATVSGGLCFFWQGMRHADKWHRWFPSGYRLFASCKNFTQHLPTPVQYGWDPVVWWPNGKSSKRAIAGMRDYHVANTAKWICEKSNGHPCPRPIDAVQHVVSIASADDETVLDPFMGSGTTGVACIRTGRKFIGIEKEPRYFEIARKRLERAWQDKCSELPFEPEPQMVQRSLLDESIDPQHEPASGREGE